MSALSEARMSATHEQHAPERSRLPLLGTFVQPLTMADLNRLVDATVAGGERRVIANVNMHSLCLQRSDTAMREFFEGADYVHVDGMALIMIGRWLGLPLQREHRVTYVDWIHPLMSLAATRGWRVFYLGSRPGIPERAAAVLRRLHNGLEMETAHGYFDALQDSAANAAVVMRINEYRPHILLVGMGLPRQEYWIRDNVAALESNVVLPCGGCMDYIAGVIPTPPRWTGQLGAEWLFRLGTEPRRLWRRYLVEPWSLVPPLVQELLAARMRTGPNDE
jgi:N-acetylglucosaminyldiphosphoundecaprenol N-acetyl-beta-D-mannosaminyltransferase